MLEVLDFCPLNTVGKAFGRDDIDYLNFNPIDETETPFEARYRGRSPISADVKKYTYN